MSPGAARGVVGFCLLGLVIHDVSTFVLGASLAEKACGEAAASAALAKGDLSSARAILSTFKESSHDIRACAAEVWQQGIQALLSRHQEPTRGFQGSAVLDEVGLSASLLQVSDGSWLTLPRVQELVVVVPVMLQPQRKPSSLVLEQDGFLRVFDWASVLWAPGYFMLLWMATNCASFQGKRVLELGAGLGGPSILASLCGAKSVVATEKEPHSLLNMKNNALINGVSVETFLLDWEEDSHLEALAAKHGAFDVILGAGISPQRWLERFQRMLQKLLEPHDGRAILCQGTGYLNATSLISLASTFRELRPEIEVVSGDSYGLLTRWGETSEFELIDFSLGAAEGEEKVGEEKEGEKEKKKEKKDEEEAEL